MDLKPRILLHCDSLSVLPYCADILPGLIRTRRMYFSPRKFLISTRFPFSWMTTLMGKWAYTERILYRKPCSQRHRGNELKRQIRKIVLSTMTCYVAAQPHKRNHDRKIHQSPFNGRTKMNRVTLKSDTGGISQTVKFSHQSDSLDHVLDMAADGADCGQLLPVAPPFIYTELRKTTKQLT